MTGSLYADRCSGKRYIVYNNSFKERVKKAFLPPPRHLNLFFRQGKKMRFPQVGLLQFNFYKPAQVLWTENSSTAARSATVRAMVINYH